MTLLQIMRFLLYIFTLCNFLFAGDIVELPSSLSGLTLVGIPEGGGNQAVFILQDSQTNKKFILKILDEPRLKEEILAGRLYKALGVNVPANRAFYVDKSSLSQEILNQLMKNKALNLQAPQILVSLSEFIEGQELAKELPKDTLNNANKLSDLAEGQQTILKQIQLGFVADCFLGNWDITAGFKNIMVTQNGKVYRFDNGGALRYRALGSPKSQQDLDTVAEITSLRDPKANPDGAVLFKFVTDQEIKEQINFVLSKEDKLFKAFEELQQELGLDKKDVQSLKPNTGEPKEDFFKREATEFKQVKKAEAENSKDERVLKSLLLKRLQSLAVYSRGVLLPKSIYEKFEYIIATDAAGIANYNSSAGMLNYMERDGQFYVLLGKRVRHEYWGNFGGGSDPADEQTLSETAAREVREESSGMINIAPQDLRKYPSHDLVSKMHESDFRPQFASNDTVKLFRMYMVPGAYVEPANLKDKEYTAYMWVNLKDLMTEVCKAGLEKGVEGTVVGNSIKLNDIKTLEGKTESFELHGHFIACCARGQ